MDIKTNVKDGKNIELGDVTVINTLSVAEKNEVKNEQVTQPEVEIPTPVATTSTIESSISSLNPTIPNIPNIPSIELPTPNVPTAIEPLPTSQISTNNVDLPNSLTYSEIQNYGQTYDYNVPNINNLNKEQSVMENGSLVFKNSDSVTASRNEFIDKVGKLFDEKLAEPVNTSVIVANEAMELLNEVFQHGMNVSSFKKYQDLIDLYNGMKTPEKEKDNSFNSNNDDDYTSLNYGDLSRMNIPRF